MKREKRWLFRKKFELIELYAFMNVVSCGIYFLSETRYSFFIISNNFYYSLPSIISF